jgi:TonB family protein
MTYEQERFDRSVVASVFLHAGLFAFVLFSPKFFPTTGMNWGSPNASTASGISVKIAGSVSGIALPTPEVVSETAPANDDPGFYKAKPVEAPPEPTKKAVEIPDPKVLKTPPAKKAAPSAPSAAKSTPTPEIPPNAVPTGDGGRPSMSYGEFSTGAGAAGVGFGDAAFGDRFGTYVNTLKRTISNNWLKSMVDARVQKAPRVYVTFDIERDGTVVNVGVQQSSGIPSLDRSAQRAVSVSSLPPLPSEYRGSKVNVIFYFEYSR